MNIIIEKEKIRDIQKAAAWIADLHDRSILDDWGNYSQELTYREHAKYEYEATKAALVLLEFGSYDLEMTKRLLNIVISGIQGFQIQLSQAISAKDIKLSKKDDAIWADAWKICRDTVMNIERPLY